MMTGPTVPHATRPHGPSLGGYITGFVISMALTLAAYLITSSYVDAGSGTLPVPVLMATIITLAITQFVVQMVFFLHIGQGRDRRANILTFGFMALVLGILVVGSVWIMKNLDYHMLTPAETLQYMKDNQGL